MHGEDLLPRLADPDIFPMHGSIDKIFFHEPQRQQKLILFPSDLKDPAVPDIQKTDGFLIGAGPCGQIPVFGHLEPVFINVLCQKLHRTVRQTDFQNHTAVRQPCHLIFIDNGQLPQLLLHDLIGTVTGKEISFFHRIHQRIITAEQNPAFSFIEPTVHITIDKKIHTPRILHPQNPEIMGIIKPSFVFSIRKTVDPA